MEEKKKAANVKVPEKDRKVHMFIYLFIYLFNRSHQDYNAKIRLGKKIHSCEQVTKTRDEGAGHTTDRGSKLRQCLAIRLK